MRKAFPILLLLCLGPFATSLHAQEDSTWQFHEPKLNFPDKPTITLLYGSTKPSLSHLNRAFASGSSMEIKLGFSRSDVAKKSVDIREHQFTYLSAGRLSPGLGKGAASGEVDTDVWRVGIGLDGGYGYAIGSSSLIPFHSSGVHWSGFRVKSSINDSSEAALLSLYDGPVRFGTKTEGGVVINIIPSVGVNASFERSLIFSRHLFWKWAGSMLLEGTVYAMIDKFVDKIMESSPGSVPVVSFVLKNSLSYALYELRRERMNWPFETEPPILHDSFKFGLTLVF